MVEEEEEEVDSFEKQWTIVRQYYTVWWKKKKKREKKRIQHPHRYRGTNENKNPVNGGEAEEPRQPLRESLFFS